MLGQFVGRLLISFGTSINILLLYIAKYPALVLLTLISALFAVIFVLLISICWFFIFQNNEIAFIVFSSIVQELGRYSMYLCYKRFEPTLDAFEKDSIAKYYFACGFGYGLMILLIFFVNPLAFSLNAASLPCTACPSLELYFISAFITLIFQLQHICWGIIAFASWARGSHLGILWTIFAHTGSSLAVFQFKLDTNLA
jgi:hypothetical protein